MRSFGAGRREKGLACQLVGFASRLISITICRSFCQGFGKLGPFSDASAPTSALKYSLRFTKIVWTNFQNLANIAIQHDWQFVADISATTLVFPPTLC